MVKNNYSIIETRPLMIDSVARGFVFDIGHERIVAIDQESDTVRREPALIIFRTDCPDEINRLEDQTGKLASDYQRLWDASVPVERVIEYVNENLPHEV